MIRDQRVKDALEQKKELIMSVRKVKGRRISVQKVKPAQRCCKLVPRRLVISFKNKWRSAWDFVPMGLSLYNALTIPLMFTIALPRKFYEFNSRIDVVLDVLFLIDNLLVFITSFRDKMGNEVKDPYQIFKNYTHSWRFVFDTLSLLGMSFFTKFHSSLKQFQLFKATRVVRINSMINKSRQPIQIKGILKIGKLVFFLFLYLHWLACFWNLAVIVNGPDLFMVNESGNFYDIWGEPLADFNQTSKKFENLSFVYGQPHFHREDNWHRLTSDDAILGWQRYNERWDARSKQWNMPIDFVNPADQGFHTEKWSVWQKYCNLFYYAQINLGLGEIGPVNIQESAFLAMTMIISALVFTNVFGEIVGIFQLINREAFELEQDKIRTNTMLEALEINLEAKFEINEFNQRNQPSKTFQRELDDLLESLCFSLQLETMGCYFLPAIYCNPTVQLFLLKQFSPTSNLKIKIQTGQQLRKLRLNDQRLFKRLNRRVDELFHMFVEYLISMMGTFFLPVEEYAISLNERSNAIYFVAQGTLYVSDFNFQFKIRDDRPLLAKGDMFGEIGCLYNCNRTCTIKSADYSILARLTKPRLRMITSDYPLFLSALFKTVFKYKDDYKTFMKSVLGRICYFRDIGTRMFHSVIYRFKQRHVDQNEVLLRPKEVIDTMIIVATGELEIVIEIDGADIVVARLGPGDALNHRNVLLSEMQSMVMVRCSKSA